VDTRTSVDDKDYQPPFRFTGKLDKLTVKLEPAKMATNDEKAKAEAIARLNN
jgi:arylsulfatase